jgi:serine phosphatase RsbU (regulator of sigma subunit)/DNA-binding response OmpR family regulator/anti-sigma regulatory factor (Ser/Thr protein kinase)
VLVVDDNADMREYVAGLLARHYRVETAVDGIDALAVVDRFVPDLVITDVMMPRLDGFGLLQRLHADPRTLGVPVIMLSARAGEEGTVEGLEAGADDYLVKPFSARELLARVRVNLELDRAHRVQRTLVHSQQLLDQAQRMAKVGSWEIDPDTGAVRGSDELLRILEVDRHGLATLDYARILGELVHPDDRQKVDAQIRRPDPGAGVRYEARLRTSSGAEKLVQVRGELVTDASGHRVLRGSVQDITEQRALERAVAQAAAREQVAAREHAIADELQRRLLPRDRYELDRLDVATYYRSGVEGTQVGGDWFDVVELGVGRVALVVGDVMGRGIPAASVMGQVRSALRAMVRLDLDPGQVVEQLDGFVRDLDGDQIVTCVVAVLDPTDHVLHYANAGHVPPVLGAAEGTAVRLDATAPPLGTGGVSAVVRRLELPPGAQLTLFTDGLVEHRGESLDRGLDALARLLATVDGMPLAGVPQHLVDTLLPEGPDDDVALLVARVTDGARACTVTVRLGDRLPVIARAREQVATTLEGWGVPAEVTEDLKVMASELVTNALVHGEPPLDVRLTHLGSEIVLEVDDRSPARPHRVAADRESEHGRGLQIVATLADRWGTRTTGAGKTVWCSRTLPAAAGT